MLWGFGLLGALIIRVGFWGIVYKGLTRFKKVAGVCMKSPSASEFV